MLTPRLMLRRFHYNVSISVLRAVMFLVFSTFLFNPFAFAAIDSVKLNSGHSDKDIRYLYNLEVMQKALEATRLTHGDYKIIITDGSIPNKRLLQNLESGMQINAAMSMANQDWENRLISIKTPVRQGIFNYRLLLVNKFSVNIFKHVKTIEDLKRLKVGIRDGWTTSRIMKKLGYKVTDTFTYESLFSMLDKGRFDYVPRGVHEIYDEFEIRRDTLKNLVIEPNIALYMPMPNYIYVSPTVPHIAKRLEVGLQLIIENGSLNQTLETYFGEDIVKADIKNRLILDVGNPFLAEDYNPVTPELWQGLISNHN